MPETIRRTALFEAHRALGAKIVPFGGFEMPVSYTSILREHAAVRHRAGVFDLSHMAQFDLSGPGVGAFAETLTVNRVANMKPGQARYNIFTNERGGAHDDVIFYRLDDERWLLVVNAANAEKMTAVLGEGVRRHMASVNARDGLAEEFQLRSRHGERALIAIQGPKSVAILSRFVDADIARMKYYSCIETAVRGVPSIIARTGYTGEDGFEIFCAAEDATDLWDALLAQGRPAGLEPAGLGARDVLRLEAGMPLYGHELTEDITPIQAGLGWAVKLTKPEFPGRSALESQVAGGDYDRIAGLVLDGRVPARSGYPVFSGDRRIGEVRSGSTAPSIGNRNIATALVAASAATEGTRLDVEIRGTRHAATVVPLPFYKRPA
jgi:aminomethyltransferase